MDSIWRHNGDGNPSISPWNEERHKRLWKAACDTILVRREPMLSIVSLSDCTGRIETPSETRLGCLKGRHNGFEIAVDKSGILDRHKWLREVAV